jgi:hypothetical protein
MREREIEIERQRDIQRQRERETERERQRETERGYLSEFEIKKQRPSDREMLPYPSPTWTLMMNKDGISG